MDATLFDSERSWIESGCLGTTIRGCRSQTWHLLVSKVRAHLLKPGWSVGWGCVVSSSLLENMMILQEVSCCVWCFSINLFRYFTLSHLQLDTESHWKSQLVQHLCLNNHSRQLHLHVSSNKNICYNTTLILLKQISKIMLRCSYYRPTDLKAQLEQLPAS